VKLILAISVFLLLTQCKSVDIYPDKDGPLFLDNSIQKSDAADVSELSLLSFNIERGKDIPQAILEIEALDEHPDFLLLQEMTEHGVKTISKHPTSAG